MRQQCGPLQTFITGTDGPPGLRRDVLLRKTLPRRTGGRVGALPSVPHPTTHIQPLRVGWKSFFKDVDDLGIFWIVC